MVERIIFILFNIYEVINGVSTKYIKFIEYLSKKYSITLFIPFIVEEDYEKIRHQYKDIKIIITKGLIIPIYKEIKIPILGENDLKKEIKTGNEIIIFQGEFIWMYELLYKVKEKNNGIKIYPNMHTDYFYYYNNIYASNCCNFNLISSLNCLNDYLCKKKFDGMIVTGEKMREKYLKYTDRVFNANEVNLDIFRQYNIKNNFNKKKEINIVYCGRLSKEKNIEEVFECCNKLVENKYRIKIHIIGDGPLRNDLRGKLGGDLSKITIFYGSKTQEEIYKIYRNMKNCIFLYASTSETFGKTPLEACVMGIPIFIKRSEMTDNVYRNKINAFIFEDSKMFIEYFEYFFNLSDNVKDEFIINGIKNVKKYNQKDIFLEWSNFLTNTCKNEVSIFDVFMFYGVKNIITCTGSIFSE